MPTLQQIIDYLRKNKDQYPLEVMKQYLCKQGVPEAEVEEAVRIATGAECGCPMLKPGQDDEQEYDAQEYTTRRQQNIIKVPFGCLALVVALVFASCAGFLSIAYLLGLFVDMQNVEVPGWLLRNRLALVGMFLFAGYVYFYPSTIAREKRKKNTFYILLINLAFGWTVIGWIIAFRMARRD